MEIHQLNAFVAIVEEGTVTGAAKRLHMTQPPLTVQLHGLEEDLGCKLFEHHGRRLRLTDAGQMLYQRAKAILGLCDTARSDMAEYSRGTAGTLRIGVVSSVRTASFFQWMSSFSRLFPAIRFDISCENTYCLIDSMQSGQLDVAFVRTPFSAPDLRILPIREEKMLAVGKAEYFHDLPESRIPISSLAEKPLIFYRRWESILRSRFEAEGLSLSCFCRNDDAQTTLALAESGLGIGVLPASAMTERDCGVLSVREIEDEGLTTGISAVYREVQLLPQCAKLFLEYLNESEKNATLF